MINFIVRLFRNRENLYIIIPSFISIFIIVSFILLAMKDSILDMKLNEIGDSLAGFSGVLAFLWLIITVLLQSRDLKLQYEEIKDMRAATQSQAESLKSSQLLQTLEYTELKLEKIENYIVDRRDIILNEIKLFSQENGVIHTHEIIPDLADLMCYFIIDTKVDNLLNFDTKNIRNDFTYQSYLRLSAIHLNINQIIDAYEALLSYAVGDTTEHINKLIKNHQHSLNVYWCNQMFPHTNKLNVALMRSIVKYKIGTDFNQSFLKACLEHEANK